LLLAFRLAYSPACTVSDTLSLHDALPISCIGVPMALVCAVDNQRRGYRATIDAGLAVPLGEPPHKDLEDRVRDLIPLLSDSAWSDRKSTRLNSSHVKISYAVFCLKKNSQR